MFLGGTHDDEERRRCYICAVELSPTSPDAHERLGDYYDLLNQYDDAENEYRVAIACGAGVESYRGLASVLAQQRRTSEALAVLDEDNCPFSDDMLIRQLKAEIRTEGARPNS